MYTSHHTWSSAYLITSHKYTRTHVRSTIHNAYTVHTDVFTSHHDECKTTHFYDVFSTNQIHVPFLRGQYIKAAKFRMLNFVGKISDVVSWRDFELF